MTWTRWGWSEPRPGSNGALDTAWSIQLGQQLSVLFLILVLLLLLLGEYVPSLLTVGLAKSSRVSRSRTVRPRSTGYWQISVCTGTPTLRHRVSGNTVRYVAVWTC